VATRTSDAELFSDCLGGHAGAWRLLIERYTPLIYSIPRKHGLSETDAADIFQAVCVRLFQKLGTIRDPELLPAWLITTATRESWAHRRRACAAPAEPAGGSEEPVDPAPLPEDELLALERQGLVRLAIEQLPEPCRRVVVALFDDCGERLSYEQLARLLGLSANSIGPTRARCLERLRALIDQSGYFG
jgi:RNA polymerase sigma factor (sigma-70 family)